jgi:hypothetical protein
MKTTLYFLIIFTFFNSIILAQKKQATIYKTNETPTIDGIEDELWQLTQPEYLNKNFQGEAPTLNAYWKMLWDNENIYVLVNVDDDDHFPAWESGGNGWEYDKAELYFDVNEVLEDGNGPAFAISGHWQSAPNLQEDKYGEMQLEQESTQQVGSYYAYQRYNQGYIFEWKIPLRNLIDKDQIALSQVNILDRNIGFDVNVIDQDEGITVSRQRKVWQNDGAIEECWNSMDDAGIIRFETLSSSDDTVVCGTNIPFVFNIDVAIENVTQYSWDLDGGDLLDFNKNSCKAKWSMPGKKEVILTVENGNHEKFLLRKNLIVYPNFSVIIGEDFTTCLNSNIQLNAAVANGVQPFYYYWNYKIGNNSYSEILDKSKNIFLQVIDHVGCIATNSVYVSVLKKIDADQICRVSIENGINENKIEWSKSANDSIQEYQIMKESNVANQYELIGTVNYSDDNFFIDEDSKPSKYADRYILLTVDKCGNVSSPSAIHKNIHLQVSPGLPGYYNLSWTPYIGFEYGSYYIYKGHTIDDMKLIDQVSSSLTQYTDTSSTQVYYQVAVKRNSECNLSANKSVSESIEARSNIELVLKTSINQYDLNSFKVYPNPTSGIINLSINVSKKMFYKINDISGKTLINRYLNKTSIDLSDFNPGQYIISIIEDSKEIISFPIQKE